MSLQFILGPTASGKTNRICRKAVAAAAGAPTQNFIVIVPEQATLQMQKRIVSLAPGGAVINIDILSFERLAFKVFDELGLSETSILDDTGKILILRKVLGSLSDEILGKYKGKVRFQGFVKEIMSVLSELSQYDIDDNSLFLMEESAKEENDRILFSKIRLIREAYAAFKAEIKGRFTTREALFPLLSNVISDSGAVRGAHIYLDGFTGFTPVQYRLMRSLMKCAADVTVALTLPPDEIRKGFEDYKEYDLFKLPAEAYFRLRKIADEEKIQILEDIAPPVNTGQINESDRMFENLPPEVQIKRAKDAEAEVCLAAEEISGLVREEGFRYRDIAVVCADLEEYHRFFADTFRDAKIPCFIDYKSELSLNPLSRFIICAANLAASYSEQFDNFFALLATGITDVSRDEVCLLENYCLEFGIKTVSAMEKPFTKNRALRIKNSGGGGAPDETAFAWNLEKINEIRKRALSPILPFYKEMTRKSATAGDFCLALSTLLEKSGAKEKMLKLQDALEEAGEIVLSREYARIYELTEELNERIKGLLGTEQIGVAEFTDILKVGLDSIKIGAIPPSLDTVTVGDVVRTRFDKPKVIILTGANSGKLPSAGRPKGFLTETERRFLKERNFEIAPTLAESLYSNLFYIYLILNKASDKLIVSFATVDSEGESAEPAFIAADLMEKISKGNSLPAEDSRDYEMSKNNIYRKSAALKELSKSVRKYAEAKVSTAELEDLLKYFAENDPDRLYQILDGAVYTNLESPLDFTLAKKLYGETLRCSVSSIGTYNECAFKHFLGYGLRLKERPEYRPDYKSVGTIYHGAIELYSKKLKELGLSFRTVEKEQSEAIISEAFEEELLSAAADVFDSSRRLSYHKDNMLKVLKKTVAVLGNHVKAGDFEPDKFEYRFKRELSSDVVITGIIDRIDVYDAGDIFIRIIDYKSGAQKFDVKDIYTGLSLQLPAYLASAIEVLSQNNGEVKPAGLYYYHIADGYKKRDELKTKFRMMGPTNSDEKILVATDKTITGADGGKSDVVNIEYKNGAFKNNSKNIVSGEELKNLMDYAERRIIAAGEEILSGNVEINPYDKGNNKNACTYCEFASVCKFEPVTFDADFRDLGGISTADAQAAVYGNP